MIPNSCILKISKFAINHNFSFLPILFTFLITIITFPVYSIDKDAPYICTGLYKGKSVSRLEVESLINSRLSENNKNKLIILCGANFKEIDLSNMDLSHIDFREADLQNTNFTNSNLSDDLLQNANLSGANLTNAFLKWTNFNNATLSNSILNKANISDASLENANLERSSIKDSVINNTNLSQANLRLVNLEDTSLIDTTLAGVDLTGSILNRAIFIRANLKAANLTEIFADSADFTNADLTGAKLNLSQLSKSKFEKSILKDTDFSQANLKNIIYKPNPSYLPNIISLATAKNFDNIIFYDNTLGAPALTILRYAYANVGMRNMERLITSMIKTEDMKQAWKRGGLGYIEAFFSYFLFYLTSDFGASPGKPLLIFLFLMFLCAIPYRIAIRRASEDCAIYKITVDEISRKKVAIDLLTDDPPLAYLEKLKYELKKMLLVLHISVLSSFQIGFQHFDISAWISKTHTKSYYFVMKGWIRSIVGIQSLLSLYLVILWALTYFGHPFTW